jgi:hypothetical protein
MNPYLCILYDLSHIAVRPAAVESSLEKLSEMLWMGHGNLMGEVKTGVYIFSGLGQMHRVWGLHKRLPGQLF